jgi:dolichol kinase
MPEKCEWLWFLGGLTLFAFLIEGLRFMMTSFNHFLIRNFSFLMRAGEEKELSGIVYYLMGCFLSALAFPRMIALMSILFLAVGDPIAALVGVRWGKHRYHLAEPHRGKSLEGSAACGFVCFILTFAVSYFISKTEGLVLKDRLLFSILGGSAAMIGELIPFRTDDNMALPLLSGALLWLTAAVLNLIPGLYL